VINFYYKLYKMVRQTKKKQRGRGQGMSAPLAAPRISLIDIIRSDADDEEKMVLIDNAIQGGADINERDADGISPLIALITNTNSAGDFIKDLIGRDINYIDNKIGSALHYAIVNVQDEYMVELLENGANINLRNASGQTPLFLASLYAIDDYVHTLLDRRADYTIPDNEGRLPIEVVALEYNGINRINNKYNII
jgi:ankyrin repeat protein